MQNQSLNERQQHFLEGTLEQLCQQLEITQTQFQDAEEKYKAVGAWLADSDLPHFNDCKIYPQGSMRLGTTVRPLGRDEFDIDLVVELILSANSTDPKEVKQCVGIRLAERDAYEKILEEMNRCWRLNYAESSKLHMDIMPCLPDTPGPNHSVHVPDKELRQFKQSNPEGYAKYFDDIASLEPDYAQRRLREAAASIDPIPEMTPIRGTLRRIVQLSKRHRDLYFGDKRAKEKPISILLTTLLANTYGELLQSGRHKTQLELIRLVINECENYIEIIETNSGPEYWVRNPMNREENFAEKWNTHPERRKAFIEWKNSMVKTLENLTSLSGMDQLHEHLGKSFGESEANKVINLNEKAYSKAREEGLLLSSSSGLGLSAGKRVQDNTFYGC